MKRFLFGALILLGMSLQAPLWACGFCSGKPKSLSSGGTVAQEPGASQSAPTWGSGSNPSGAYGAPNARGPFTTDLKNYKADGQRSTNEKWSSGDFFDNR